MGIQCTVQPQIKIDNALTVKYFATGNDIATVPETRKHWNM